MTTPDFPLYVRLVVPGPQDPDNPGCLLHRGRGGYWRHGGMWGIQAERDDHGVLRVAEKSGPMAALNGVELAAVDEATWRASNGSWAPQQDEESTR